MNLASLDIRKWWKTHKLEIISAGDGTFVGECPWKIAHVSETNRCTVTPGEKPKIICSDPTCVSAKRTFDDLLKEWADAGWHCQGGDEGDQDDGKDGIEPMGFTPKGEYYYRSARTGHIVAFRPKQHDELNLYSLIPNPAFWRGFADSQRGISWKMAARKMMAMCQAKGYYFKSEMRGSGIFFDRKRLVVNTGPMLLVNEPGSTEFVPTSTAAFKGEFIYASTANVTLPEPASDEEIRMLLPLLEKLPFENAGGATVLVGALVCGWLAGALKWRPHFWMNSKPGGGKSEILNLIIKAMQPFPGMYFKGDTTAAGIRDATKNASGLFIVDELEKMSGNGNSLSNASTARRADQIIEMMRSASESSTASIAKGDPSGDGMQSQIRCCAFFASVYHGIETSQDYRRFCFIPLTDPKRRTKAQNKEYAEYVQKEITDLITPEYTLKMYSWAVLNSRYILETIDYFVSVMLSASNDRGECDQWGAVLGAAWCLTQCGKKPSPEEIIKMFDICHPNRDAERLEKADLDHGQMAMTALRTTKPVGERWPIGEAIDSVLRGLHGGENWDGWLERLGLKVRSKKLVIHPSHPELRKVMAASGYASYRQAILSYPGAKMVNNPESFFGVRVSAYIEVPLEDPAPRPVVPPITAEDVAMYGRRDEEN